MTIHSVATDKQLIRPSDVSQFPQDIDIDMVCIPVLQGIVDLLSGKYLNRWVAFPFGKYIRHTRRWEYRETDKQILEAMTRQGYFEKNPGNALFPNTDEYKPTEKLISLCTPRKSAP